MGEVRRRGRDRDLLGVFRCIYDWGSTATMSCVLGFSFFFVGMLRGNDRTAMSFCWHVPFLCSIQIWSPVAGVGTRSVIFVVLAFSPQTVTDMGVSVQGVSAPVIRGYYVRDRNRNQGKPRSVSWVHFGLVSSAVSLGDRFGSVATLFCICFLLLAMCRVCTIHGCRGSQPLTPKNSFVPIFLERYHTRN